ncbi:MAG: Gfo/Idh/MocA family oxidoreductase [Bryobacteraceae bacterium]|nr:Gfo/Idh/MocA family oxidoreductase [Bryobacteraceae bacterium]MDW8378551.1 Gfo/Idh/MocA family oxidoreductase [Bryobacterales bacterium]
MPVSRRSFLQTAALAQTSPLPSASPNDKIQIGVLGAGARSHELMQRLLELPAAKIVGVCDAYSGRLTRTVERVGKQVKTYPSHHELFADPSIDAVLVVTPDHWHRDMVLEAFRRGKDVYCEKPLTYRSSEGPEIIAAARQTKRILVVGSQGVSSETQRKAREWIRSGRLGRVTMIRAAYNRNTASGAWIYPIPPDASPKTVNWDLFQGPAPRRPFSLERFFRWRCFEDYSGGIATDLFVHLCTTIHYLMDAKMPSRVLAMGQLYRWTSSRDVPDTLNAILEYPEGFTVNLSSTFNNQFSSEAGFHILGTEGTITLGDGLSFYAEHAVEDNRWIVESWPTKLEQEYYRDPKVRESEMPHSGPSRLQAISEHYRATGSDPTLNHLSAWLEAIRTRKPPYEDAVVGHRAAACAHMVNRSVKTRALVEWDFARDDIKS